MLYFYFESKTDHRYHVLDGNNEYKIMDKLPQADFVKGRATNNVFYVFKGYEPNEEGLRQYKKDFTKWSNELREFDIIYPLYGGHYDAVHRVFIKYTNKRHLKHRVKISPLENWWWSQCNNGFLSYCDKGIHDSYGYDFSAYYPSLLADENFKFPIKDGYETTLTKLPKKKKLQVGIYNVKIQCDNKKFQKAFRFNTNNMYSNYSLYFAMKHKKKYDIKIEMVDNGDKPNCYLYDDKYIVDGAQLFGEWYKNLTSIKKTYPKNKLLKHLLSSLWGHLSSYNHVYKTQDEIDEQGLKVSGFSSQDADYEILEMHINDTNIKYKLIDNKDPYKYKIRLKPFLTSFGRVLVGSVALKNIKHVIRIHTDNITYNKPIDHKLELFLPEDKTTGKIEWININNYKKVTS